MGHIVEEIACGRPLTEAMPSQDPMKQELLKAISGSLHSNL